MGRAPADAPTVGDPLSGSPEMPDLLRNDEGLPGYRAVLCMRAVIQNPAGCAGASPS